MNGTERGGTHGFWRGVLTGIVLAAAIALGLALAFPPTVFHLPSIRPEAQQAPAEPAAPAVVTRPGPPAGLPAQPAPDPAPPIAVEPSTDELPDLKGLVAPAAPAVFDGGSDGPPVLAAPAGN